MGGEPDEPARLTMHFILLFALISQMLLTATIETNKLIVHRDVRPNSGFKSSHIILLRWSLLRAWCVFLSVIRFSFFSGVTRFFIDILIPLVRWFSISSLLIRAVRSGLVIISPVRRPVVTRGVLALPLLSVLVISSLWLLIGGL